MKAFQKRRLLKLAQFLHDMPRAKFDFSQIFAQGSKPPMEALAAGNHRCGTVGCAIGWMPAALPRIAAWTYTEPDEYYGEKGGKVKDVVLRNGDETDFVAAAKAFGISMHESYWLFGPGGSGGSFGDSYEHKVDDKATPKQVARHIRKFVARYAEVGELRHER